MTLQHCRRTEPFVRKVTDNVAEKTYEGLKSDVYDVANDNEYWTNRYRSEGELYKNLTDLAKKIGIVGQPVPALDKEGKKAYIIGNMLNETNPRKLDRAIFQVRPNLLEKFVKDGYILGDDAAQISDIGSLNNLLYHLIGKQPATDFAANDLRTFYPSDDYIGSDRQGQYTLLPSSSTRKEFNKDGSIATDTPYVWWEPTRYDRRLLAMTDPFIVDHIKQSVLNGDDLSGFFDANPGLDGEALVDAVKGLLQNEKEDIHKHIPSKGAITGQATQNIIPAVSDLRVIAPFIEGRPSLTKKARDRTEINDRAAKLHTDFHGQAIAKPLSQKDIKAIADKLTAEGKTEEAAKLLEPSKVAHAPAISPTPGVHTPEDFGIPKTKKTTVTDPSAMEEGRIYTLLGNGGAFINEDGEVEAQNGEILRDAPMVSTPYTRSASQMFADMRAARNAKKNAVIDESGNVDVVKSSTSSLFDRMKRHR